MSDGIPELLGHLFPAGGRVAPEQMVGREGDVADLVQRLRELAHVVLSGPADDSSRHVQRILDFGAERPYDTMTACLCVGVSARRLVSDTIDEFVLEKGLEEARARLDEDS